MTTWRPASQEIDPLQEAILNAARATVLPVAAIKTPAPALDGVREIALPDGTVLRMSMAARSVGQETRNGRPLAFFEIAGNAVAGRSGYRVTGEAVVDLATKAFIDIRCRLESVGAVRT